MKDYKEILLIFSSKVVLKLLFKNISNKKNNIDSTFKYSQNVNFFIFVFHTTLHGLKNLIKDSHLIKNLLNFFKFEAFILLWHRKEV